MNIYIRCDASNIIGTGHVMRCLTLANELTERGAHVSFICHDYLGNLNQYIQSCGYQIYILTGRLDDLDSDAEETARILEGSIRGKVDWLIIDNYALGADWEKALRPYAKKIMVIDDLANRKHVCDLLLDQNLFSNMDNRYNNLLPDYCEMLLGSQYAMLRNEFKIARQHLRQRSDIVSRILVFFGGSDLTNETVKAISAIRQLDNVSSLVVDVVVGAANQNKETIRLLCENMPNFCFYCQTSNMAELMSNADMSIGGGGSTAWERCCVGLPSIVITVADNQVEPMQELANAGVIMLYTGERIVSGYLKSLQSVFLDKGNIECMLAKGMELYDGRGVERVVNKMLAGD